MIYMFFIDSFSVTGLWFESHTCVVYANVTQGLACDLTGVQNVNVRFVLRERERVCVCV